MSPPFASLRGLGLLFHRGRGLPALRAAVREGARPPVDLPAPFAPGGTTPAFPVDLAAHGDRDLLARLRRADRFTQLAAVAARDALADAALDSVPPDRLGLIVASALGPHVTTFRFLDEILTYGDQGGSAFVFSHSVHNAAASYLATLLGLQGPALTIAQTDGAFHESLQLAGAWLATGRCDHVLVGAVDELGEVMRYVCHRQCPPPPDGRIQPLAFTRAPATVPGEGSFFFVLGRPDDPPPAGRRRVVVSAGPPGPPAGPLLVDADGMSCDESAYAPLVRPWPSVASYTALCGGLLTAGAFHAAVATAALREGGEWPAPDLIGPARLGDATSVTTLRVHTAGHCAWLRFSGG